jgi:hypothetical protein
MEEFTLEIAAQEVVDLLKREKACSLPVKDIRGVYGDNTEKIISYLQGRGQATRLNEYLVLTNLEPLHQDVL